MLYFVSDGTLIRTVKHLNASILRVVFVENWIYSWYFRAVGSEME